MNTILFYIVYIHTEKGYVGRTFGGPLSDKYYGGNANIPFPFKALYIHKVQNGFIP